MRNINAHQMVSYAKFENPVFVDPCFLRNVFLRCWLN